MPCCRFRRAERCGMPQQCSYPAKTKFDSTHVVVQGQAEQVCIVVRVCCVCGQWVQQKCLYYVPQLTVLHSQRTTPEKCKVLCPPCWQATHPGKMRSCQVHAKILERSRPQHCHPWFLRPWMGQPHHLPQGVTLSRGPRQGAAYNSL